MAVPKVVTAQRDFSAGAISSDGKRDDESKLLRRGARQMSNWRILNAKGVSNRPGRRAMFLDGPRVEEVLIAPGVTYYLVFGNLSLKVRNSAGAVVFTDTARPWTTATAKTVVWAVYQKAVYITFTGMVPRVLTWDGATTWTAADYAPTTTAAGRKLAPFYRIAPPGITMSLSALTGAGVTVTFSAPVLNNPGHIGTRFRYYDRQITITGVTSPTIGTATVNEILRSVLSRDFTADITSVFAVGDVLEGLTSGNRDYVAEVGTPGVDDITAITLDGIPPTAGETVVGPSGQATFSANNAAPTAGPAIVVWDEEVMNAYRGWPQSVFVDQNRIGFCNFPALPAGIAWSAVGVPTDLNVGAEPTNAIFELAPDNAQVLFVVPGAESSEFVFCDNAVWYIPITPANPLQPGSVVFVSLSKDGCANVQPRSTQEFIAYVAGNGKDVMAVLPIGAEKRPFTTRELTDFHAHLFGTVIALAIPASTADFPERYIYALNADGTVVVGKITTEEGRLNIEAIIGWVPWSGVGTVTWVSARAANVLFTSSYAPNGIAPVALVEVLDDTHYLDGALLVNSVPAALAPGVGDGPLWWLANGTVELIDLGTRWMGTYAVDADGFIVPQGLGGEDLASVDLVAGQKWTAVLEPFVPPAPPGQDQQQRLRKRRVCRFEVYAKDSTGFVFARLFAGPLTPTSPALGTVMNEKRIMAWDQGDNADAAPPQREQAYPFRPIGRAHDPRNAIIKDTPGPLTIPEVSMEVTV